MSAQKSRRTTGLDEAMRMQGKRLYDEATAYFASVDTSAQSTPLRIPAATSGTVKQSKSFKKQRLNDSKVAVKKEKGKSNGKGKEKEKKKEKDVKAVDSYRPTSFGAYDLEMGMFVFYCLCFFLFFCSLSHRSSL